MIFSINKIVENRVILIAGTIKKQTKELLDEDGEDLSKNENVIDEQKLAEQEEIIRRITKKREV